MKCVQFFNWNFGSELIKYLDPNADVSMINDTWC